MALVAESDLAIVVRAPRIADGLIHAGVRPDEVACLERLAEMRIARIARGETAQLSGGAGSAGEAQRWASDLALGREVQLVLAALGYSRDTIQGPGDPAPPPPIASAEPRYELGHV